MRPVISSKKHYVQITRSQVTTVTRNVEDIVRAVAVPNLGDVDEVVEGAIVKAVYVELWALGTTSGMSQVVVLVKSPSGVSAPTFTNMNALNGFTNKKNILFTHQGLSANDGIANPMVVMRGWFKIPKGKQRFGLGDKLHLVISNSGTSNLDYCGFAIYKEYT